MDIGSIGWGILISLAACVITKIIFTPRLSVSKEIIITPKTKRYRVAVMNNSWLRDACEIFVQIRYHFDDGHYYSVKVDTILFLNRRRTKKQKGFGSNRVILNIPGYKGSDGKDHTVDDFFSQGQTSRERYIEIFVIGNDPFEGARALKHNTYQKEDIRPNCYFRIGTVEVESLAEEQDVIN